MQTERKVFQQGKWIWYEEGSQIDSYGEFYGEVDWTGGEVNANLSCDSDYALYINGQLAACNQYGDFEYFKIYDTLNLTPFLKKGKNHIAIVVWHFGETTQKYLAAKAGLIFEISCGEKLLLKSGKNILCRKSKTYKSGFRKRVSSQLGWSFLYDSTKEDGWKEGVASDFMPATEISKSCEFYPRPNEKLRLSERKTMAFKQKAHSGKTFLVDLGEETVGLPWIEFHSPVRQKVTVFYGEHLLAGNVQRFIGGNDYSFEYIAKEGENSYLNPFLRLGCRYLQVYSEEEIELTYLGVLPQGYPVEEKPFASRTEQDRAIERLCVNTLKLCMLEHYVDCPWREQGLYAFDSRNQMLAGYYAFGNYAYAKSNLLLMSMDCRKDDLLSITTPSGGDLVIPSFSLYYVLSVWEYLVHSGDKRIEESIFEKVTSILQAFAARKKEGLIHNFSGEEYWHFYDWSEHLTSYGIDKPDNVADLALNCLYAWMLNKYKDICSILGKENRMESSEEICEKIKERFYNREDGLFTLYKGKGIYTMLGNSLAILCGAATGELATNICERMLRGETVESSLSTKVFLYDALLMTDREKYAPVVLERIRKEYLYMLQEGATATWETLEGASAFAGNGSLCHGWSAMPVYYFHLLKDKL